MTSESVVLKECLEFLQINNIYCWRNNTGCLQKGGRFIRFGYPGSSDILGICPDGRFLAIECKKEKNGILSDLQKKFLTKITMQNGVAIVVNSLESLIEQLKKNHII